MKTVNTLHELTEKCLDGSYEENYMEFLKQVRYEYSNMLGNSKTLSDVIIHNEKTNVMMTIGNKLLLEDIADILFKGEVCGFGRYLLTEPVGEKKHKLKINYPSNYKNYPKAKFEFNYLVNKIGLVEVVKMMGALAEFKR